MTGIEFSLVGARGFSINKAYYNKGNMKVRTQECRAWGASIVRKLANSEIQEQIKWFREQYKPDQHGLAINLSFGVLPEFFFTKSGLISIRSLDLTNVEKLLVDIIFNKKFDTSEYESLNIDDKCLVQLYSEKIPSQDWIISVSLSLVDLNSLGVDYDTL